MPQDDVMRVAEAMQYLGVSRRKIAALIAEGELPAVVDPLDKRSKLVKRADVEALAARSGPKGQRPTAA